MDQRLPLASLNDRTFDVVIIGSGMNGASAAQQLTAAGYDVLLIDKGDFCAGSSSKSGMQLHCGLRYLAPGDSIWDFARSPSKFRVASRMASQAMKARAEFIAKAPRRAEPYQCAFPVYRNSIYRRWQTEFAFRLLRMLGGGEVPLDYKWHAPSRIDDVPLARWLRDRDNMLGLVTYREYHFEWPERICVDMVMDTARMGGVARNYTLATKLSRDGREWRVELRDRRNRSELATVRARRVLNMAGIWIDRVNATAVNGAKRRILGTKGIHITVKLPPECEGYAVHTFNREREGYSCSPFRGMHSIGPTETVFEGDVDDIKVLDDEIDFLIEETNYIFPSLNLKRDHIFYAWAGVRPLGADDAYPKGKRSREIHDLTTDGMPGVFAMTAGPIMTHRSAGQEITQLISSQLEPRRERQIPNYNYSGGDSLWQKSATPQQLSDLSPSLIKQVATNEQITQLADFMFGRAGIGWAPHMGYAEASEIAAQLGGILNWNAARIEAEAVGYRQHLETNYRFRPSHAVPALASAV